MNNGHAAVTATMVQAPASWAPHGWLHGAAGRAAPPGAVRRLREQRERLRASGPVNSRLRVGRIAEYRRCRDGASCSGRGPRIGVHTDGHRKDGAILLWRSGPHRTRGNRRVPADTLRGAVQSAYSHTPRVA